MPEARLFDVGPDPVPAVDDGVRRDAEIRGRYRYWLTRSWDDGDGEGEVLFVMLNPSTADADVDDPTIRRCIGFARAWGFDKLTVANLFALRATDPDELAQAEDPVGPLNDSWIVTLANEAEMYVAAWGAHPFAAKRAAEVLYLLEHDKPVCCLGVTKGGHPRHPLYVSGSTPVVELCQALEVQG